MELEWIGDAKKQQAPYLLCALSFVTGPFTLSARLGGFDTIPRFDSYTVPTHNKVPPHCFAPPPGDPSHQQGRTLSRLYEAVQRVGRHTSCRFAPYFFYFLYATLNPRERARSPVPEELGYFCRFVLPRFWNCIAERYLKSTCCHRDPSFTLLLVATAIRPFRHAVTRFVGSFDRSHGGSITGLVARSVPGGAAPFLFLSFHLEQPRPACSRFLCWPGALPPSRAMHGESCGTPRGRSTLRTASTSPYATFLSASRSDRALLRRKDYIESSRSVSNDTRDWIPRPWTLWALGPFLFSRSSEVPRRVDGSLWDGGSSAHPRRSGRPISRWFFRREARSGRGNGPSRSSIFTV